MDEKFQEYFSRLLPLPYMNLERLQLLHNKLVTVIGLGGLGSISSEQILANGIGNLRVIDCDLVDFSNLPRQKLYTVEDVGFSKAEIAQKYLSKRNPYANIEFIADFFDMSSAPYLLSGSSAIIDALDNFQGRDAINRIAYNHNLPWVFGGGIGTLGNVMTVTFREGTPCFSCMYDTIDDESLPNCASVGVNHLVLSFIANIQVNEITRLLLGEKPYLEGKILLFDLDNYSVNTIKITQRKDCPVCSKERAEIKIQQAEFEIIPLGKFTIIPTCRNEKFIIKPTEQFNKKHDQIMKNIVESFQVERKGNYGFEFKYRNAKIFILKSFIATIKGVESPEEAISLFEEIVNQTLC